MTLADGCLVLGYVAFVVGVGWQFGLGWAAMVGGGLLMALGRAAYRAKGH